MTDTRIDEEFLALRRLPVFYEFDDRQLKEIILARHYADSFAHGTDGHNRLLLIAQMSRSLESKG